MKYFSLKIFFKLGGEKKKILKILIQSLELLNVYLFSAPEMHDFFFSNSLKYISLK